MKKRIQDTVIQALERKIAYWESFYQNRETNWTKRLEQQKQEYKAELELQEFYKKHLDLKVRVMRRQRNMAITVGVAELAWIIFKPP